MPSTNSTRSWTPPTPDQISKAVALLGRVGQYRYFFDQLKNPLWLEPLSAHGFLKNPPVSELDERTGYVRHFTWPDSRYLLRMAGLPEAQESVLKIAMEIAETNNPIVNSDLADVALALPPSLSVHFIKRLCGAARSTYGLINPGRLVELIRHLAKGGEVKAAIALARVVLDIGDGKRDRERLGERTPLFDLHDYGEALEQVRPDLVAAAGQAAFDLFADLLERAVRLLGPASSEGEDWSTHWRSAIEDHGQNHSFDVRGALVITVRDAAEQLAAGTSDVRSLVASLERRPFSIFHRLALHLLRQFADKALPEVERRLTNHELFLATELRHEYFLLSHACFAQISKQSQDVILSWIDSGPDLTGYEDRLERFYGKRPTPEDVERHRRLWQRDRLSAIGEALPESWRERNEALITEFGVPEHPDFLRFMGSGFVGPVSPKTRDEIQSWTSDELVNYLKDWKPTHDDRAPSREGLGRQIVEAVKNEPARFSAEAERFIDLDPTYVRSLIDGVVQAVDKQATFHWNSLLALSRWIVERQVSIDGRRGDPFDQDPDWSGARQSVLRLLSFGLEAGANELPVSMRPQVWALLAQLCADPDPSESDEQSSSMDPLILSINTTRGQAMHAVIRYGLWLHRLMPHDESATNDFDKMPEVRDVLERHLDLQFEPTLTVRSVYGQWFPWLALLDPKWAAQRADAIFSPMEQAGSVHLVPAWEAYILFSPPYDNVLEFIHGEYMNAIARLDSAATIKARDPESRLAEHLMVFYVRGRLDLEPSGMLHCFFERASPGLRGHAIEFVGRSLPRAADLLPNGIERLIQLWEWRLAAIGAESTTGQGELAAFGSWFASGLFPVDWSLQQLKNAVAATTKLSLESQVAKRLAEIAPERPLEAVQILISLWRQDEPGWGHYRWRDHAGTILQAAIASSAGPAVKAAVAFIDAAGREGHLEFRELLPK